MSLFKQKPSKLKYRTDTITLDEVHKDLMNSLDSNYKKLEYLSKAGNLIVEYYDKTSGNHYDYDSNEEQTNIINLGDEIKGENKINSTEDFTISETKNKNDNESCYETENENMNEICEYYQNNENEVTDISTYSSDKLRLLNLLSRKDKKIKKPVKKRQNNLVETGNTSIFNFFQNEDRESSKSDNKELESLNRLNRAELQDKFLFIVDKNYACNHVKIYKSLICEDCNVEKILDLADGSYKCKKCGKAENIVMETENNNYKEVNYEKTKYPYKKINHLKEKLNQFQSKETADVPNDIYETIINEIKKKRVCQSEITPIKIRMILKKYRHTNYYEHLQQIYCKITNSPPITLSRDIENKIVNMFLSMQDSFQHHRPPGRSNFLSYYYILNKLFRIIGMDEYSSFFPLLKSKEKLRDQDNIWSKICRDMNWKFHSSF